MDRLTDSKIAENLKSNYEGLQRVGIEPSVMDLRYVRLAELEEENPKLKAEIAELKELLRLAKADLEEAEDCDSCLYGYKNSGIIQCPADNENGHCQYTWQYFEAAMRLLGEEDQYE